MRALLLTALLAGIAAPAIAAPDRGNHHAREARSESSAREDRVRADRNDNSDRAERADRAQRADRGERAAARAERQESRAERRESRADRQESRAGRQQSRAGRNAVSPIRAIRDRARSGDSVATWREAERRRADSPTTVEQRNRWQGSGDRTRRGDNDRTRWDRDQARRGDRDRTNWSNRDRNHTRWSSRDRDSWRNNWRNDRRHDWRDYRNRNRSIFHLGFYTDPFGWGYQRYNIGWQLRPNYYSSRYWIGDPSYYRLPYAPPGMQWIRYYDDAILVDTFTGEVADVIYNFFW